MTESMQKVRLLARAEAVLLKIHLRLLAKQTILCAAGLFVVVLAIAMANVAGYMFFAARVDPSVAALIVAGINAVIAAGLFLRAKSTRPGEAAAMAEEVRNLAMAELQADTEAIRADFNEVKADVKRIRSGFTRLTGDGGSGHSLLQLGPLFDLLTGVLKRGKKK